MESLRAADPAVIGGRYELLGRLGSGGMGSVYLGRSPGGRLVAVKCVHRELADDPEFRRRFRQELEAMRRVGGFHTAQVVDADPDGEPPWLVTAYVQGPSLAEAVTMQGPFPETDLRRLGAGLAEALVAIHAVGLVHRDLKPSNVLLAEDGPRVIDFGIARALDGTTLTRSQVVVGTPGYMAPEQIAGGDIGPACDVFSLGRVLCHAAGGAPFGQGDAQVMLYRIMHTEPDLTAVPPSLREAIAACLTRDPAERPAPAQLVEWFRPSIRNAPTQVGPGDAWAPIQHPVTSVLPTVAGPPGPIGPSIPVPPSRRLLRFVIPVVIALVAAAVCVPLFVLHRGGGSGTPNCFPAGKGPSQGVAYPTSVPAGTPGPPELLAPANKGTVELGQAVTLSWNRADKVSRIYLQPPDGAQLYSPMVAGGRCSYTPAEAGLYTWSVSTGSGTSGSVLSSWSETRYLFVSAKGSAVADPAADDPDPPQPVSPVDQATVPSGQPVTLSWQGAGVTSMVTLEVPGRTWQSSGWLSGSTYTFTPATPGVYAWSVTTESSGTCNGTSCVSPSSVERYLIAE